MGRHGGKICGNFRVDIQAGKNEHLTERNRGMVV